MRRGLRPGQVRPTLRSTSMSRDLDWLVDRWEDSSPEVRMQLVLAKIRAEEKLPSDSGEPLL